MQHILEMHVFDTNVCFCVPVFTVFTEIWAYTIQSSVMGGKTASNVRFKKAIILDFHKRRELHAK